MNNEGKFLVIGLDGATLHLVKRWAAEGKLPNLAKIMAEGSYGHLKTVPNQNSAPAWSSFMTGKNPGKHGVYHFYEIKDNSYDVRYLNGSDVQSEPVWSLLSKAGKQVGVLNVPMTYPARTVNGYIVSGMDAPGKESIGFACPESIASELLSVIPDYVVEPGITSFVANERYDLAVEMAKKSIKARADAALYLMEKYPWDFFMVVFRESDVIQHHFWKFMEGSNLPDNACADWVDYADTILHVYQMLDREIGRLISKLPEDRYIMVMSDHGSAAAEGGPPYINYILKHMGILKLKGGTGCLKLKLIGKALAYIQRHTSRKTKEHLLRYFPKFRDRLDSQRFFSNVDWLNTKAFAEPTRMEIWINLKGREPLGTVMPGEEYDSVCEKIKTTLYRWHDPVTGKRVVKNVFRKEEIYHGKYLNKAPDILMIFEDDVKVSGVMLVGENGEKEHVYCPADVADALPVNGVHRDNGLFMLLGPGIKKGYEISGAQITDLTPTILHIAGQHVPSDMDGTILAEIFEQEVIAKAPIVKCEPLMKTSESSQEIKGYSDGETRIIEERLRALGYIE